MSKPNENGGQVVSCVPKLRFEGFEGEWEEKKLEDLSQNRLSNGVFNDPKKIGTNYKLINVSDMYISGSILDDNLSFVDISEKEFLKNNVEYGDIFFTRSSLVKSGIAYSNIYLGRSKNITFDCHLIKLKPNTERVYPIFLNYILRTNYIRSQLVSRGKTATMTTIGQNDVAQVKLSLPSLPEQQKIASCLSSLDDLISAESQKLESLKEHKKGLMQKLFPKDGQTVPELRFEGFEGDKDWDNTSLKDVFKIFQGFAFSSTNSISNGIRWLKIADVGIQRMNPDTPSYLPTQYEKEYNRFSVKHGDYVLALTRPILNKQLKISKVDSVFHGALLNQRVGKLETTQNIDFVYYLLQTSQLITDIEKNISGSEPPNLSAQQIESIKTYIPSLPEQQKIASCLSSLDDLITAQADYIHSLKQHKKGLMQQLFPSMDETN